MTISDSSIYSIAFLCQFTPEVMDPLFDLATGMLISEREEEGALESHTNGLGYSINNEILLVDTIEEGDEDNEFILEMKEHRRRLLKLRFTEIKRQKRLNIMVHTLLTYLCQIVLISMTFYELLNNP